MLLGGVFLRANELVVEVVSDAGPLETLLISPLALSCVTMSFKRSRSSFCSIFLSLLYLLCTR